MIRFLDKASEQELLAQLFDILYDNMSIVAPSGFSYEEEKARWLSQIAPALEKTPRQIVLMYVRAELAGYLQYYVNGGVFMVEEIQIRGEYRQTTLLFALFRFMKQILPTDTAYIEAYADRRNLKSRKLIGKLSMQPVGEDGPYLHYRGDLKRIIKAFD